MKAKETMPTEVAVALSTGRAEIISAWARQMRADEELSPETITGLIDSVETIAEMLFDERRARAHVERRLGDLEDNLNGALSMPRRILAESEAIANGATVEEARAQYDHQRKAEAEVES